MRIHMVVGHTQQRVSTTFFDSEKLSQIVIVLLTRDRVQTSGLQSDAPPVEPPHHPNIYHAHFSFDWIENNEPGKQ